MVRPVIWKPVTEHICFCGKFFFIRKGEMFSVKRVTLPNKKVECKYHVLVNAPEPERWAPWIQSLAENA
jgi:hypothetical protein